MPDEALVKGQTVLSFLKFLEEALPPEKRYAVLATAPQPWRDEFSRRMVLATNTYPIAILNSLTVEGARAAGVPMQEFARRAGRFAAKEGVRGVYRVFVRVLSPGAIIGKAAAMWSTMNSSGKMTSAQTSPTSAVIKLTGFAEPSQVMCARVAGWIEQLAEMAGVNPTITHTRCAAEGASDCEWTLTW